jgi:integrase
VQNRVRLTDLTVRSLAFTAVTAYRWDTELRGFGIRIGKQSKCFVAVRDGGRRISLGKYPAISLKIARERAKSILYGLGRTMAVAADAPKTAEVVAAFLKTREAANRASSLAHTTRNLARLTGPLGDKPITAIITHDLTAITDGLMATPSAATHTHTAFKTFFNWAVARRYITHSPLAGVPPPAPHNDRDRILSDRELIAVYNTARLMGYPFGCIVLTCIHTMMRRSEVGSLKWSFITDEHITLPKELTKNGREHILPNLISPTLACIPRVSEYLFPSSVGTPFSGWSKSKRALDKLCGVTGWTLHDLRRTGRSKLAEWDCCSPEIAERILGHVTAQSKIARVYNRWGHLPQMRVGMERYEHKLRELLQKE